MGLNDLPNLLQIEMKSLAIEAVREIYAPVQLFANLSDDAILPEELSEALRIELPKLYRLAQSGMPHTHLGREYRFFKPLLIEWITIGTKFDCNICSGKRENSKNELIEKETPTASVIDLTNRTVNKLAQKFR